MAKNTGTTRKPRSDARPSQLVRIRKSDHEMINGIAAAAGWKQAAVIDHVCNTGIAMASLEFLDPEMAAKLRELIAHANDNAWARAKATGAAAERIAEISRERA